MYTDREGEARLREAFGRAEATDVELGWEDRWREFHRPVRVGPLWIGPPWEAPPDGTVAVIVEPARAFGTGAHPTTRLCLELLLTLYAKLGAAAVLDVGCGSGVLAIAAAALGFSPVHAVDMEAEAVEETRRNAAANGVEVEARIADALRDELPPSDVVLANVERATVEALALRLRCRFLVASGYLERDEVLLSGFDRRDRRVADGWAADVYERRLSVQTRPSDVGRFSLPC